MLTAILAAVLVALTVWLWPRRRSPAARLAALGEARPQTRSALSGPESVASQLAVVVGAPVAVLVFLMVGGPAGVVSGLIAGAAIGVFVHRREPAVLRRRRARMAADLPFAADLIVACLRAGQPLGGAVSTAADAVGGPMGERLAWVGARIRLGADPSEAWLALRGEPSLAGLAAAMSRATASGAPVADVLGRLADDARHANRAASSAAARRVGVQAVAPLGLCFLPAFVFLGIVPVVAGLAAQVLGP